MKTITELRGTTVSEMRLVVVLRLNGFYFDDEEMASIRGDFEKFVSGLPKGNEVSEVSISYLEPNHYDPQQPCSGGFAGG